MCADLRKCKGALIFGHATVTFRQWGFGARRRRDQAESKGDENASATARRWRTGIVL